MTSIGWLNFLSYFSVTERILFLSFVLLFELFLQFIIWYDLFKFVIKAKALQKETGRPTYVAVDMKTRKPVTEKDKDNESN